MARKQPESKMQQAFMQWLCYAFKEAFEVAFKIPNEGVRSVRMAAIMKAEGLRAGVPDLLICMGSSTWNGLFIEFKIRPNKPSASQLIMMERFTRQGFKCVVCYDLESAITETTQYLKGVSNV